MSDLYLRNLSAGPPGQLGKIYTVSELTRLVRDCLESRFPAVWVTGEISNLRTPGSGHLYFTLKDANAQLRAVIWRGVASRLRFRLEDGLKVIAFGSISVYEARGEYQLIITQLEPKGVGALQLAFEQLKRKLEAEGLFDPSRKRPLPFLPQRIGIVTSPSGAAIRDMLTIIARRFPFVHIILAPVRVQGEGAAQEIAQAIDDLNRFSASSPENAIDVLIVGRGGGSLEDLWAFNEEPVARAIFHSAIPVVSAVGHEIDFTIADFVADVRAATPSAAAELVVPRLEELEDTLSDLSARLVNALRAKAEQTRQLLDSILSSHGFRAPLERVRQWQQRLDEVAQRIYLAAKRHVASKDERLATLSGQIESLSPLKVLSRGYSITTIGEPPRLVKDAVQVRPGDTIATRLHHGRLISRVESSQRGE